MKKSKNMQPEQLNSKATNTEKLNPDKLNSENKPSKRPRILAWIGIAALVLLYALTFLTAILDIPGADRLFPGFLITSILLPLLLWVYIWIYKKVKDAGK